MCFANKSVTENSSVYCAFSMDCVKDDMGRNGVSMYEYVDGV